jgi:hypothetical protein
MADTKITALTALTGSNSAPGDLLTLVDVSDTTMDAAGTNKSITRQELQTYNAGTLTTDVKVLDLSATWNDAGVTFTGLKFNVTDTASNAASLLLDLQVGGASKFKVAKTGFFTATRFVSAVDSDQGIGLGSSGYFNFYDNAGVELLRCGTTGFTFQVSTTLSFGWSSTANPGSTLGVGIFRDADQVLAQRNSTNAQTFRLYNTFTNASNYERLAISWGSNIVSIAPEAAGTGTVRVLHISGLPTSNPGAGILWNNGGTVEVGT